MAVRTPTTPPGRPPTVTELPRQEVLGVPVGGTGTLQGNVESLHRQLNALMGGVNVGGAVGAVKNNIPTIAGGMAGGLLGAGLGAAGQRGGLDPIASLLSKLPGVSRGKDTSATSGAGAIGSVETPAPAPSQQVADPLSLQMFFTNTIAPYLEQLRASMAGTTGNIANQMQGMVGQVPANMRSLFNPNAQAGQANTLATALAGATAAGPTLDNLMAQIQEAANMQRFAAYQALKQQAGADSANALGSLVGILGGGEEDDFAKQLEDAANQNKKK